MSGSQQELQIIALEGEFHGRLLAITKLRDFETLEMLVVSDENKTIRQIAFSQIMRFFKHKKKAKELIKYIIRREKREIRTHNRNTIRAFCRQFNLPYTYNYFRPFGHPPERTKEWQINYKNDELLEDFKWREIDLNKIHYAVYRTGRKDIEGYKCGIIQYKQILLVKLPIRLWNNEIVYKYEMVKTSVLAEFRS